MYRYNINTFVFCFFLGVKNIDTPCVMLKKQIFNYRGLKNEIVRHYTRLSHCLKKIRLNTYTKLYNKAAKPI